ncbi:hypothetical protein GCM10025868_12240 [Angustibacter aerolatus]|uniref:Uncharacterized protein n=1 Tax=Angustibacter aerolatus TaxID=1162965 RepID=A0ABQ6JEX1_9ACTN|nr:hypothetical protein GCM10025868_12240 [Angustibacter aerolatus]
MPSAVRLEQVADPLRQSSTDAAAVAWHDDAPDEVVLGETGHLAVCGAPDQRDPLGRWLLAQVAAGHSPRDVHLRVLGDEASLGLDGSAAAHPPVGGRAARRPPRGQVGAGRPHRAHAVAAARRGGRRR